MIMKGLWRYHAINPSQPHNPSRKSPWRVDEANITEPAGLGAPSLNAVRRAGLGEWRKPARATRLRLPRETPPGAGGNYSLSAE
jgi:hypothetical protein